MPDEREHERSLDVKPKCLGKACVKRQAGLCKHGPASKPEAHGLALVDGGVEEKLTAAAVPRVERRSKLRLLLMQDKAQSLVEFALTVPALLLVVTGIAAFGIAFNNYMMLTEATSVGARQLTVSRGQTTDPCKTFANAVYAAAPMLKTSSLTFSITLNGVPYPGTTCIGTSTSGAPSNMVLGTNAVATVTYPISVSVYGMKIIAVGSVITAQTTELMQ